MYTNIKTSIIRSEFRNALISVGCGVLQGDCLSLLLFNMRFKTFIQHTKCEKYRQFKFTLQFLSPIHWFQFADDIGTQEFESQHLLNWFSINFGVNDPTGLFLLKNSGEANSIIGAHIHVFMFCTINFF